MSTSLLYHGFGINGYHYPTMEYSWDGFVKDTKNIGKNETDRRYLLSMQVMVEVLDSGLSPIKVHGALIVLISNLPYKV